MGIFDMLYCDNIRCRVNEFERGKSGQCPACGMPGEEIEILKERS